MLKPIQNGERGLHMAKSMGIQRPELPKPKPAWLHRIPSPLKRRLAPDRHSRRQNRRRLIEQALNRTLSIAPLKRRSCSLPKRTRAVVVVQNGWVIAERYAQEHSSPTCH